MIPAKMTSEPQDLQNYLQAPQNWSHSLHDVTKPPAILSPRPAFWSPPVVFIFCLILLASPNKYQNISLHIRLSHSLKNRLINNFDMLIHSIVLELFFCKSLHKGGMSKRRPL